MSSWERIAAATEPYARLHGVIGLLQWDQQVHMPAGGAANRAAQLATLTQLLHAEMTKPELAELLASVDDAELEPQQRHAVHTLRRRSERARRLPSRLVGAHSEATARAFNAWLEAREARSFAPLAEPLARVFELTREQATAIDEEATPYDVLLEEYDPGVTTAWLRPILGRLEVGLRELLGALGERRGPELPGGPWPIAGQERLHREIVRELGFDLSTGRLDASVHPFTVALGAGDVRITTHLYEDDVLRGLTATLHECGHGLYEQGMPRSAPGTSLDSAASLGLHESQSRFWENGIGRSAEFLRWLQPRLVEHLGEAPPLDLLMARALRVTPSLIRIAADEVTYDLHIITRVQLEMAMLHGELAVADLPDAWSEAMARNLGIRPEDDLSGCLQDVHWPQGAIGYFPSYTLGNLFSTSLLRGMEEDLEEVWSDVEAGHFEPVLGWLREHVHSHGHGLSATEIVRQAAGERDQVEDRLSHLWDRYGRFHGVQRP